MRNRWLLQVAWMLLLVAPLPLRAAEQWGIPAGQEAVLERALATTPAWPKGWQFTGAQIDHGAVDARYRNPQGVGLGVRLQHPAGPSGPRQAGQFEISNVSADLPDDVLAQIKLQLTQVPAFTWLELHDRAGDAPAGAPAAVTATAQAAGDALLAATKPVELLALLARDPAISCDTRLHWVATLIDGRQIAQFALANDIARYAPACPRALGAVARWSATLGQPAKGEAILRELLKSGPQPLVQVDLALLLRQEGRCGDALAVLHDLDLPKIPGISQELARLSRIFIDCPDPALLATMRTRADATPPDPIAAFVVGSILHHDGKWSESDGYLLRAEPLMHAEPREYLYRAMNAWHQGRQADAEQLVGHAAAMGSTDPDVLYCRAMIFADGNVNQAIADLLAYDKAMVDTQDKTPGKQAHVHEILQELQACQGAKSVPRCRQLRQLSRLTVQALPGVLVVVLAIFALVRWRRRR